MAAIAHVKCDVVSEQQNRSFCLSRVPKHLVKIDLKTQAARESRLAG